MNRAVLRLYIKRFVWIALISLAFVSAVNEISFLIQKEQYDRAPQIVQIVIPPGTATQLAQGKDTVALPEDMVFVTGDTLEVINQDVVGHQLGPIWVPAGSRGSLLLERAEKFSFSCSFQSSRYLDLDVRQPTTLTTRLIALSLSFPTMASLLFLYSLLAFPIRPAPTFIEKESSLP